ncbi:hypothetical protein [Nannocystis pusilla]|uniref:hypothetical protein n=1 Tax=Nannocystis pusilla TaxID=889268 RepID=UPI003B7673BA
MFGCPEPTMAWDGAAYVEEIVVECSDPSTLRISASRMQRTTTLRLDALTPGWLTLDGRMEVMPHSARRLHTTSKRCRATSAASRPDGTWRRSPPSSTRRGR